MADGVLITGFPGFIATRLVERLVADEPGVRLFLLCEPRFVLTAKASCEALEKRLPAMVGLWHVVEGDIVHADLGLARGVGDLLREHVSRVWHLAAIYDLAVPASLAYRVNVDGTLHILDLCERLPKLQRLNYISTCYVAGDRTGRVYEDELDRGQSFKNHYESTKCWAEKHVRHRMSAIPTTIYRPSIVVGDSTTGVTQKGDGPYFVMQLLFRMPQWAPMVDIGPSTARVNLVPIDFVIDAMARLDRAEAAIGATVALADPDPLTAHEVLELFLKILGRRPSAGVVPVRVADLLASRRIAPFVRIPRQTFDYFNHPVEYDTTVASRLLAPLRPPCPALDTYLSTLVSYARQHPEIFARKAA